MDTRESDDKVLSDSLKKSKEKMKENKSHIYIFSSYITQSIVDYHNCPNNMKFQIGDVRFYKNGEFLNLFLKKLK